MAKVDPLGLDERKLPIELDPQLYGFSDKDLDRECASAEVAHVALAYFRCRDKAAPLLGRR
jgi:2-oxoglutarate dehydrogenase complex dehydrogenase (E1) component-like enzyme